MPLETVKLTASFKLDGSFPESLFSTYREVLGQMLDYAWAKGVTSFKRLRSEKYYELRARYPSPPSHHLYTACQMACSIYKSFRKLQRIVEYKAKPEWAQEIEAQVRIRRGQRHNSREEHAPQIDVGLHPESPPMIRGGKV
jgi:putative transposase